MSDAPVHFYLTFNPHLNKEYKSEYTQAHAFFDLLKEQVKQDKTAWWGKIIGPNRKSILKIENFQNILAQNSEGGNSTHLYITDFQNLWVAKVVSVNSEKTKTGQSLPFYEGRNVEIWFEISDMTLLEFDGKKTASRLSDLYIDNQFMPLTIDELSPFTTGIKYPCYIQDLAEEAYFDEIEGEEQLCLGFNAGLHSSASVQVIQNIQNYAINETIYQKLPHAAKKEIEAAELDMLQGRYHNLGRIAFSYLKALEIVLNHLILGSIKKAGQGQHFWVDATTNPPKLYLNQTKDHFTPLSYFHKNFSINALIYFVERCTASNNLNFRKAFTKSKKFLTFLTGEYQKIQKENQFIEIRNALAHNQADLDYNTAMAIRNIILGVGTPGIINRFYQLYAPHTYGQQLKVQSETLPIDSKKEIRKGSKLKLVS
ncbi:hypothetical protein N9N67_00685 [Bacteriovoracaceae bacterium]|nr:hypothetical protein [Bacteriovoracaceae bacterium]